MADIGQKLETKGVIMTLLSLVLISTGCKEQIDPPAVNPSEGETVEVTLNIGIADEEDGAGASVSPASKTGSSNRSAFEVASVADVCTKATGNIPDKLYNLDIIQYISNGTTKSNTLSEQTIGAAFGTTVGLTPDTGSKLLFVARGATADFGSLSGKTLSAVQDMKVKSETSKIKDISTDAIGSDLANMPYYLYLENVNITSDGKIQSPAGKDVRLLLKRLAVKVQLDWTFAQAMTDNGYILKEVKLCQVPAHYRLIPQTEPTDKWGNVYPTSVAEFVDVYRLTGINIENGATRTQTVWIPANARGTSSYSNSPYYRNKTNANPAATYAEFVVDNSVKKERLYYRVYLGGNETSDFNLLENTNYHWTVNINKADYANDPRIQLLDQTPVESTNEQPTSNCFMMLPGTNICFNPYKHEAGTDGWNTELTTAGVIQTNKTIDKVKVLWQTKDAGTSGDLVMGYVIDETNHQNLVNLTNGDDIEKARIHIKVPVTNGGNAVVAAYNGETIVWSWHIWISDYVPVGLSGDITTINRSKVIEAAQSATRGGMVQVYGGISWIDPNGAFYKCVIMDRHLGAIRAGMQTNQLDGVRTFGLLYQGGRKDPFFSSADGTTNEAKTIYNGYGVEVGIDRSFSFSNYQQTIEHPLAFCKSDAAMTNKPNAWNGDKAKTIYDPCPQGWRVPSSEYLNNANQSAGGYNQRGGDGKSSLFAGFGFPSNSSYVTAKTNSDDIATPGNILFYDGTALHEISEGKNKSDFPGSGYLYIGGSGESKENYSEKSAFFPGVSLREYNSANYRANNSNNALYLWSSTQNNVSNNKANLEFNQISADNTGAGKVNFCFQLNDHRIYGFSVRCIQDNIFDREPADYQADLKK